MSSITDQLLSAFDEEQSEPEPEPAAPQQEEEVEGEQAPEQEEAEGEVVEEEGESEPDEEEAEGDDEEEEEQEEAEVTAYQGDDPAIQAFLNRYGGDVEKALRGAVELEVVLGRQGSEKNAALQQVQELRAELEQQRTLAGVSGFLSQEQQQWVEEAVQSGNPRLYVQGAMQQGEFDLARAVVSAWAREDPYEAMRVGQVIDGAAVQRNAPPPEPVDRGVLLQVLAQNYPEMGAYWGQMESVLNQLGPGHPTVADAQSEDIEIAARGIVNLYEIARASNATVKEAKATVKRKQRQAADEARAGAVVSSGTTSRTTTARPATRLVTPGLTFEQLEEEFEAASK